MSTSKRGKSDYESRHRESERKKSKQTSGYFEFRCDECSLTFDQSEMRIQHGRRLCKGCFERGGDEIDRDKRRAMASKYAAERTANRRLPKYPFKLESAPAVIEFLPSRVVLHMPEPPPFGDPIGPYQLIAIAGHDLKDTTFVLPVGVSAIEYRLQEDGRLIIAVLAATIDAVAGDYPIIINGEPYPDRIRILETPVNNDNVYLRLDGDNNVAAESLDWLWKARADSLYLTGGAADLIYLSIATAAATYLPTATAAATYLSIANATATYLSIANATATYLPIATASATYLPITTAAATYLSLVDAATTYLPVSGGTITSALTVTGLLSASSNIQTNGSQSFGPVAAGGVPVHLAGGLAIFVENGILYQKDFNGVVTPIVGATGITWPLLGPDGTAVNPSYSFTNYPGSGMAAVASGLTFSFGGAAQWRLEGANWVPNVALSGDLGDTNDHVKDAHVGDAVVFYTRASASVTLPAASGLSLFVEAGAMYTKSDAGAIVPIRGGEYNLTYNSAKVIVTPWAAAQGINLALSNSFEWTLLGSVTALTLINPRAGTKWLIEIIQGGAGSFTVAWPVSFMWVGGVAPVLSTTPGARDALVIYYNGANFLAQVALGFA